MTRADKPTTRLTYSTYRGREIAVTIHPTWIGLRLKGTRQTLQMDVLAAYQRACMAEADKLRAERRAKKLVRCQAQLLTLFSRCAILHSGGGIAASPIVLKAFIIFSY